MNAFEEYIKQGEPPKKEKGAIWQTSIGLQQVDGLSPSDYLIEVAKQHIEGDITLREVQNRIDDYYKIPPALPPHTPLFRTEEADKVSARIAEILSEHTFSFSPAQYLGIHRRLFSGIFKRAGKIRDYNISKPEWVLGGNTVIYASAPLIRETLEYDFRQEKIFSYRTLTPQQQLAHIVDFISAIWQIHAFGEGNTRTTAVFAIQYLRSFGFSLDNEPFDNHSRYFRNALVRANYNDYSQNVYATTDYLYHFFENVLFRTAHPLKNRDLHLPLPPPNS
ncbi:MAG: Fic family protein [Tannerellaceae bacterium]|jgi:fido (protein-threonine AMPylation protein)|nr:Fic family protein [Tannerellaceae bacterium]